MDKKVEEFLDARSQAYTQTFDGPHGEVVLEDLSKFCRAHQSTSHANPYMSARLDGRREVWLRIQQHCNLDRELLWKLFV